MTVYSPLSTSSEQRQEIGPLLFPTNSIDQVIVASV